MKRQQRLELKRARRRRHLTAVMIAVIAGLIVLWIRDGQEKIIKILEGDETPVVEPPPPPPPPPPPTTTELVALLDKSRDEREIQDAFNALGDSREEPVGQGGESLCFSRRGVEFLFDAGRHLNKVRLFSGLPDEHQHAAYKADLPVGIKFGMLRSEAQIEIDNHLHRHVVPELGMGDCDKFELREEGYRLYLIYSELDGEKRIREVQLLKREDLLEQHAALAR